MNLHFQIRFYRGDLFRRFLREIWPEGRGHGSYLVQLLGTRQPEYQSGMPDNTYTAQKFLEYAVEAGWLVPDVCHPTVDQQFFGMDGLNYKRYRTSANIGGRYGVDFFYKPNSKSKGLKRFVETGKVRIYTKDKRT